MHRRGGFVCLLFLTTSVCHAASVCVNPGGTGGCLASIQDAVTAVAPRGRIDVAAGTYGESVIIPVGARIQIYGAGAGLTIIDGSDGDPVMSLGTTANSGSNLVISDVTLTGGNQGLLVYNAYFKRARAAISRSIITANTAEGVNVTAGWLRMADCSVTNNGGHGILNFVGRAKIERSTISGNLGDGIRSQDANSLVLSSTVSGNSGTGMVGTVGFDPNRVFVTATTFAGNGTGVDLHSTVRCRVQSSIVADSTSGPDIAAGSSFASRGYNLFETVDPSAIIDGGATDQTGVDPVLGPLQDNGGPTETQALLAGSPALETSRAGCGRADQRGVSRGLAPCDIGAFEAP